MKGTGLGGVAGLVLGGIGAYCGYRQAEITGQSPVEGALIFGGAGFLLGGLGAFILKSFFQFAAYFILLAIGVFVFRDQIEAMTGIDPVEAGRAIIGGARERLPVN